MQIQIDKFLCRALSGESTRLTGVSKPPSVSFVRGWNLKLRCQGFSCSLSLTLCWNWKNIVQGFNVHCKIPAIQLFHGAHEANGGKNGNLCRSVSSLLSEHRTQHWHILLHTLHILRKLTMNWHTSLECWANNNILDRCSDGCHLLLLLRPRCNWTPWPTYQGK